MKKERIQSTVTVRADHFADASKMVERIHRDKHRFVGFNRTMAGCGCRVGGESRAPGTAPR